MKEKNPVRYYLIWLLVWLACLTFSVVLVVCTRESVTAGKLLTIFVAGVQAVYCTIRLASAHQAEKEREP